jgi:hypothetical protein
MAKCPKCKKRLMTRNFLAISGIRLDCPHCGCELRQLTQRYVLGIVLVSVINVSILFAVKDLAGLALGLIAFFLLAVPVHFVVFSIVAKFRVLRPDEAI